jgi:hypothetical protein
MTASHAACMMTQQIGFSILTAPLAAIDRRSLSQAWYSALHLATHGSCERNGEVLPAPRVPVRTCERVVAVSPGPHRGRTAAVRIVPPKSHANSRCVPIEERRSSRSRLARAIEGTFLNPARVARQRATFTIDGTRGRVHIALQSGTSGPRLVAVCPATARVRVARALEEARYALAVRGIALRVDLKEA